MSQIKFCEAILEFPGKHFVSCELEEGHEGEHKGLNFLWTGEGTTMSTKEVHDAGKAAFGLHVEAVMNGYYTK